MSMVSLGVRKCPDNLVLERVSMKRQISHLLGGRQDPLKRQ